MQAPNEYLWKDTVWKINDGVTLPEGDSCWYDDYSDKVTWVHKTTGETLDYVFTCTEYVQPE